MQAAGKRAMVRLSLRVWLETGAGGLVHLLLPLAIGVAAPGRQRVSAALRLLPLQGMPPRQRRSGATI